jgi:transposase-like protein
VSRQPTQETRDAAVRAVVIGGEPKAVVAARHGVSPASVTRWIDLARAEAEQDDVSGTAARYASLTKDPEPSAPSVPRAPRDDDGKTTLEQAKSAWRRAQDLADSAEKSGNYQAAQRAMRDAMSYMLIIARLEKEAATTGDDVRIPRAEVEAIRARLLAEIRAACERPLLCAECSRKLSIDWGGAAPHDRRGQEE